MEIYFECTECKEVEPINIVALSANGFGLECSVCKTYFTFGVVAVEHRLHPTPESVRVLPADVVKSENVLPAVSG
jgi:hypothetical protein